MKTDFGAIVSLLGRQAREETLALGKLPYRDLLAAQRAAEAQGAVRVPDGDLLAVQRAAEAHAAVDKVQAFLPAVPKRPAVLVRHELETISPAEHRREQRERAVADALTAFVTRADADAQAAKERAEVEAQTAKERDARNMRLSIAAVVLAGISAIAAVISAVAVF
jgi:hypothetical protein